MAGHIISLAVKLDTNDASWKDLARNTDKLGEAIKGVVKEAAPLKGNVINFAALATGIQAAQRSFNQLQSTMQDLSNAYAEQEMVERKLETVMRQRMGATDEEIASIKELASEQQKLGVIGDEVQLAGAQQMATFLKEKTSIETLLPAMNNLLAQQKGLNATGADAQAMGNLIGKVMQGQTAALKRCGISFTEAQEKVLKYGTESEKAAMLAKIITDNVGEMNAELAQTDSGKQKQLANDIGDIKEQIGSFTNAALPFVTMAAGVTQAVGGIITLTGAMRTLTTVVAANMKTFILSTAAFVKNKVATLAVAAAQKVVAAATTVWSGVQKVLNLIMSANPIGMLIVAIGALVAGIIYAYNNCESFRRIVDKVWQAIKPLAKAIMDGLAKAFEWLVEKCKEAWEWLKNILGLGGKKVEVAVNVSKPKTAPTMDLGEAEAKYAGYGGKTSRVKAPKVDAKSDPIYRETAKNLAEMQENLDYIGQKLQTCKKEEVAYWLALQKHWEDEQEAWLAAAEEEEDYRAQMIQEPKTLADIAHNRDLLNKIMQTASLEEMAALNKEKDALDALEEAFRNAGKVETKAQFDSLANTLEGIESNISILQERLKQATIEEAASINQSIKAWQEKADAIKKAGVETENTFGKTVSLAGQSWGAIKRLESGITGVTDALQGEGNAWEKLVAIIDGFITILETVGTVMGIINTIRALTAAHTAAKTAEAAAVTAAGTASVAAAGEQAGAAAAEVIANKAAAQSFVQLAAAEYMAAHAYIPLYGFGIGSGFAAGAKALVTAMGKIPMLASGGIASGPTLAMVGEYAGASHNPEVIAPLSKLRDMISTDSPDFGEVEFRIKGTDLVAVLNRRKNLVSRT